MNHSRNLIAGLAALICGFLSLQAAADVLYLSSGDRLTGEVDSG